MTKTIHAVGTLIENNKGELLVLLRHKDRPEPNTYGLPGSGIKFLETKKDACIRKIFKETKLKVIPDNLEFLKTYNEWQSAGFNVKFELFHYKLDETTPKIVLEAKGAVNYMWESPKVLYNRKDLMAGLYVIIKDIYKL